MIVPMSDAKQYKKDFERIMGPVEEKAERLSETAIKRWIARAKAVGIGQMTFLQRITGSDEERRKVIEEIKRKEMSI